MRLDSQEPRARENVSINRAVRVEQLHSLAQAEMAHTLPFSRVPMRPLTVLAEPQIRAEPARRRPRLPSVSPAVVLLLVVLAAQAALSLRLVWSNTAYQDEALSLQPCSAPGTTVWIIDVNDSPATASQTPSHFPIVNGSDTDFVHPFAMTILGNPAHQPFTPIIMRHLTGNPASVPANQLWGAAFGPVS